MRKFLMSKWIVICCFGIWILTTTLQVYYPHPYRGLIGGGIIEDFFNLIEPKKWDPGLGVPLPEQTK